MSTQFEVLTPHNSVEVTLHHCEFQWISSVFEVSFFLTRPFPTVSSCYQRVSYLFRLRF